MNVFALFQASLRHFATNVALVSGRGKERRSISYAELDAMVDHIARQFAQEGLRPGDRVLLAVPVSVETYAVMLATMKAGMVAMFIDPAHPAARVAQILRAWPPAAVVATKRVLLFRLLMPELRQVPKRFVVCGNSAGAIRLSMSNIAGDPFDCVQRSAADSALLTFTSGSTGEPKPVLRTHGFLLQQIRMIEQIADADSRDIDFVAMPMFVLFNFANGMTSVLPACSMKRPARANMTKLHSQLLVEEVNRIVASPALLERLANHCLVAKTSLPKLRRISTGGGPIGPTLARKLNRIAPGALVRMVYGSTEAEPIAYIDDCEVSIDDRQQMQRGAGLLVGKPVSGCDVRVIESQPAVAIPTCTLAAFDRLQVCPGDIGEIVVSGKHVLENYADRSHNQLTKCLVDQTTWHRTGDAGYFDSSGRLWLVGRCSAKISDDRGTVFPFQVEYAVNSVSGVRRAALVEHQSRRVLVLETSRREIDSDCVTAAQCVVQHAIDRLVVVRRIPMDKRHDSKVDYPALRGLLDHGPGQWRYRFVEAVSSAYHFLHLALGRLMHRFSRRAGKFCAR